MKEFCSFFDIIPLGDVSYIENNEVIPVDNAVFDTFMSEDLSVIPSPENSDAGLSLSVSQNIVIDKVSMDIAAKYYYARYCILIVYYTDGTHTIYGSDDYPVTVYLISGIQRDTLYISLKTTDIAVI